MAWQGLLVWQRELQLSLSLSLSPSLPPLPLSGRGARTLLLQLQARSQAAHPALTASGAQRQPWHPLSEPRPTLSVPPYLMRWRTLCGACHKHHSRSNIRSVHVRPDTEAPWPHGRCPHSRGPTHPHTHRPTHARHPPPPHAPTHAPTCAPTHTSSHTPTPVHTHTHTRTYPHPHPHTKARACAVRLGRQVGSQ